MGPHKVVVGDKESGQGAGSVEIFEPGAWPGVELVGSIEPFDELFIFPIGFTFCIEVLQPDDGALGKDTHIVGFHSGGVIGGDGTVVGGQSIGNEFAGVAGWMLRWPVAVVDECKGGFGASGFG